MLTAECKVSNRCLDAPLGAGVDGDAFWWTEFVHDYTVAVDGDLVAEGMVRVVRLLAVGFAASASVDREHGNDTNVEALCSVDE